jgi:hypothetical protein
MKDKTDTLVESLNEILLLGEQELTERMIIIGLCRYFGCMDGDDLRDHAQGLYSILTQIDIRGALSDQILPKYSESAIFDKVHQ